MTDAERKQFQEQLHPSLERERAFKRWTVRLGVTALTMYWMSDLAEAWQWAILVLWVFVVIPVVWWLTD